MYVKLAHFCFVVSFFVSLIGLWVGCLWGLIGKALLCRMLWMVFSS